MKTLVVEDDYTIRTILLETLSEYGQCHARINGQEGVEAFAAASEQGEPYELIVLDLIMPVMDGRAALKRIREMERNMGVAQKDEVKVVVLTVEDEPKIIIDTFYAGGATEYLLKPVNLDKLLHILTSLKLIAA